MAAPDELIRCFWAEGNDLMRAYHDEEWGVPVHDDRKHFEYMVLDAFQAGLSWATILNKRENFRRAFDNFEPEKVAAFGEDRIAELLQDAGIIRNRQKIYAAVNNAQRFLEVQQEFGSFDQYIWQFTGGKTIYNKLRAETGFPARSTESDAMSKDLIKRGFKFVGSTICYAYMQAAGIVHDHLEECFRYERR